MPLLGGYVTFGGPITNGLWDVTRATDVRREVTKAQLKRQEILQFFFSLIFWRSLQKPLAICMQAVMLESLPQKKMADCFLPASVSLLTLD